MAFMDEINLYGTKYFEKSISRSQMRRLPGPTSRPWELWLYRYVSG